jgi:hypothetical protein
VTLAWTALFVSVRLAPMLALYGGDPRPWPLDRGDVSNPLLDLFTRSTVFPPYAPTLTGWYAGNMGAGWEFSCYLSPLLFLLTLLGIGFGGIGRQGIGLPSNRQLPWLCALIALLLLAAGPFAWWSPWSLLHALPGWGSQRLPARLLLPAMLPMGVLAAMGADALPRPWALLVLALALVDCWLVSAPWLWQAVMPVVPYAT